MPCVVALIVDCVLTVVLDHINCRVQPKHLLETLGKSVLVQLVCLLSNRMYQSAINV